MHPPAPRRVTRSVQQRVELHLEASDDCIVRGIVQWIRLELDKETCLDARPEPGVRFFSNPRFIPLVWPRPMKAGESLRVFARYHTHNFSVWAETAA